MALPFSIPTGAIVPLYLASFVMLAFQYYRINPARRLLNLQFALMLGGIVLAFLQIMLPGSLLSMVLFILGLIWLGLSLYMFRHMPPPMH
jgi:hypothetical protein